MAQIKAVIKKTTPKVTKTVTKCECTCEEKYTEVYARQSALEARLKELLEIKESKIAATPANTINKFEKWDVVEPPKQEDSSRLRMNYGEKLYSMSNAIKILPPNMVDSNGRHSAANIGAICGFLITDEMLNDVYGVA